MYFFFNHKIVNTWKKKKSFTHSIRAKAEKESFGTLHFRQLCLQTADCRPVKVRTAPGEKKPWNFTLTSCIPGRLNMPRHFSGLIMMGGASCFGPPKWFWQGTHEKHCLPRGYDLCKKRKKITVMPRLVVMHLADTILVGGWGVTFSVFQIHQQASLPEYLCGEIHDLTR